MKRNYKLISTNELHKRWMKEPGYRRAYEALEPEFQIAQQILNIRVVKKLSQSQLAKKIGTKQPVISRLEGMDSMPTITLLKKVANSLGKRLIIRFA